MDTPRRNRLDLNTPAEKAIYDAIQEIEKIGADPKLTDIVVMLGKAKDLLSDFVDNEIKFETEDLEMFNAKELSQRQIDLIAKLNIEQNHKSFGRKGSLTWNVFTDGELCAAYEFLSRDVDGDMGSAKSLCRNISFSKLIEIIKNPHIHFDTRSWN